ncbi:MAG TPA: serine hydrolase domain-containing protein, partial [Longimicrobium sp.]
MTRSLPILLLALAACGDGGPLTRDVREEPPGMVERALTPSPVPLPAPAIAEAEQMVKNRVAREWFPSGAIAMGNRVLVQRVAAYGRMTWDEDAPPAHADSTLYDLASLTKVVATTAAVMALVEDRRLSLDDPVRRWVPQFSGGDKDSVTVRQLLTHTGGVRAGASDIASE